MLRCFPSISIIRAADCFSFSCCLSQHPLVAFRRSGEQNSRFRHLFLDEGNERTYLSAKFFRTECYKRTYVNKKRTYVRNSNTQLAAKAIVKAAREEGVACWDLFAATGGKSSCTKWRKEKLMGRDRIHFTKDGYREQGTLLYRALMQSYNQMLKIRKDDE